MGLIIMYDSKIYQQSKGKEDGTNVHTNVIKKLELKYNLIKDKEAEASYNLIYNKVTKDRLKGTPL